MFEKIWRAHEVVPETAESPAVLYIDLHLTHEVTSPQTFAALRERGIRAVISDSIADISFNNALKNRLVPVRIAATTHAWLLANPGAVVEIDVARSEVILSDGRHSAFPLDPFARHCPMHGIDELGYLLERLPEIEAWEKTRAG